MLTLLLAHAAQAAEPAVPELNAQLFHMSVDGTVGFGLDDASRLPDRTPQARVVLHYVNDPLVYAYESGERVQLLSDLFALDVMAGYTLGRVRAGVELPLYLVSAGDLADGGVTLGDAALDLKVGLLDPAEAPVGLALAGRLLVPTGSATVPVGSPGVGGELSLVGSKTLGDWRLAANLGTRQVPTTALENVDWGSQLLFRAGVARSISDAGGASLELSGASVYDSLFAGPGSTPVEMMASGWYRVKPTVVTRLGLGTGLTSGIGAPLARVVASVSLEPEADDDKDDDGIADKLDACREIPEDRDGFDDTDGCPDPDNDFDGIADASDQCVSVPEDRDGFEDAEGCPDPDNDADGIADTADACRDEAEDRDDWEDGDGCPDLVTKVTVQLVDEQGAPVPSVSSKVGDKVGGHELVLLLPAGRYPLAATAPGYFALADAIEVPNGPPLVVSRTLKAEPDIGTVDVKVITTDGAPVEALWRLDDGATVPAPGGVGTAKVKPGAHAVHVMAEGFASTTQKITLSKGGTASVVVVLQKAKVLVSKEKLEILDKIYFDTNKATIKKQSFKLLDEIATVLREHPEITRVSIEGHTDSRGNDASNLKLSDARAKSVRAALLQRGIDAARLDAAGFGETRPVEAAENEVAWEKNRRVEFVIVARE